MALSYFADKAVRPSEAALRAALGTSFPLWRQVEDLVTDAAPGVHKEWGYTSTTTGWGLRLKLGKRVLLYMTPGKSHFLTSLALGEKAVARAHQQRMPASVLKLLDDAPRYAEGRGIRLKVTKAQTVRQVAHLVALKVGT